MIPFYTHCFEAISKKIWPRKGLTVSNRGHGAFVSMFSDVEKRWESSCGAATPSRTAMARGASFDQTGSNESARCRPGFGWNLVWRDLR